MGKRSVYWATWLSATVLVSNYACARTALDFFEVVKVTPSRVIKHDVSLQGRFDRDVGATYLTGPKRFSHAVGFLEKAARDPHAYFNWYEISKPATETERILSVRNLLQGNAVYQIHIGTPAFVLSPAQRVISGPPAPVSDRLSYFKAYHITSGGPIHQELKLTDTFGPGHRTAVKLALLCVPVEQWHHRKHFPIKRAEDCLLVYELEAREHSATIATIDQFGLNELNVESSVWLSVPAEIVAVTTGTGQ